MSELPADPEFSITDPPNGAQVTPTFSVSGSCSAITGPSTPTITVTVGSAPAVTAQNNADAKTWEAVINNAPAGSQVVTASCTLEGHTLTAESSVGVQSSVDPTFTADAPTPPGPAAAAAPGGNAFAGWTVGGTYNPAQVMAIEVSLRRRGAPVGTPIRATLEPGTRRWSASLGDMNAGRLAGGGFCVEVVASINLLTSVRGSTPGFIHTKGSDPQD